MLHRKNDNLQILHYVLPSVSAMVVSFAYNVVDGMFVGQGVGETADYIRWYSLFAIFFTCSILGCAYQHGRLMYLAQSYGVFPLLIWENQQKNPTGRESPCNISGAMLECAKSPIGICF